VRAKYSQYQVDLGTSGIDFPRRCFPW